MRFLAGLGALAAIGNCDCDAGGMSGLGDFICYDPEDTGDCTEVINTDTGEVTVSDTSMNPGYTEADQTAPDYTAWQRGQPVTQAQAQAAGIINSITQQAAQAAGRWVASQVGGQTVYYPRGSSFGSLNISKLMPILAIGALVMLGSN